MTRFTTVLGMTVCAAVLLAVSTISNVSAHGYMNYPTPRGIQKLSTMVDDVKNPNTKGKCRGEPAGQVTNISGSSVTLQFTITAPHIGPCSVYLLDENLGNEQKIADKNDCAAPGKVGPWTVNLPAGVSGRKVIRWHWKASHLAPQIENYEQCADIMIGGGGGSSGNHLPHLQIQALLPVDLENVLVLLQRDHLDPHLARSRRLPRRIPVVKSPGNKVADSALFLY
ncbi:hypothetical protein BDF19DRAFT_223665 [Syncephalis fuscata]|nr:hypothetical protein BDF19DRAFT_223665 [Syncephalis fuscata]